MAVYATTEPMSSEPIASLAAPEIDATDIVLNADALGLGQPWSPTNPALQADATQPGPDPSASGGPDIMSLLNPGQGISPELQNEFKRLQRGKMDVTGQIQADNERRYNEDRQRVLQQYGAENATINDVQKWDVAAERQKYHTDPIESFGSFASIFAMVASAFTRAPMENALNGAAAAMNARRENNEFEYQRSMDAFKLNSDLAIKRFNMQHTAMQDAFGIMEKDTQRGNAKLLETATKFGDEQVLALYNAGMFPEIQKLEDSRLKANEGVVNAIVNIRRMEEQERHNKAMEGRQTPDQEFAARWKQQYPEGTAEQFAEAYDKFKQGQKAPSTGGVMTPGREVAGEARKRYDEEIKKLDPDDPEFEKKRKAAWDKAQKETRAAVTPPITANRVEQLKAHIEQYDYAVEGIDRLEKTVKGVKGAFGIGGKIMRPTETFLNVIGGSNSTIYRQVEKEIAELKLRTAKLLKDSPSSGRELSSVQSLVDSLVPGMTAGSSFQSVMQQMGHLKAEFKTIQNNAKKRLQEGTGGAKEDEPAATAPVAEEDSNWWSSSPLKK